jgi:hypothetical protein
MDKSQEMRDALSSVAHAINALGTTKEREAAVTTWWSHLHRTLQQQFVLTIILPILRQLDADYQAGHTDMRNQAAAKLAHKMLSATNVDDTYLPLI